MTETEKFRTERLVARSWQIEDLQRSEAFEQFVADSPLEGDGFELLVPPQRNSRFGRAIGYRAAPPPRRGC
jgi:hypothetical protein